jgi:hypothetical protein
MTSCSGASITVSPTMAEIGRHTVNFYVRDYEYSIPFTLTIDAVDSPPYFKTPLYATYDSFINTIDTYTLPEIGEY